MLPISSMTYNHTSTIQDLQPYLNDERDYYTLTAYFIEPDLVCSKRLRLDTNTLGDTLVVKGEEKQLTIPLTEKEADEERFWSRGECFRTMGNHYWANVYGSPLATDIDKDEFFPMFLLYNNGKLNGFGWALNADLPSPRMNIHQHK